MELRLTLFNEGGDIAKQLKVGKAIRVAPAGVDRKPTTAPLSGTVSAVKTVGRDCKVTLTLSAAAAKFYTAGLARLWLAGE